MAGARETSRIEVFFSSFGANGLQRDFLRNAAAAKVFQSNTRSFLRNGSQGFKDLDAGFSRLGSALATGFRLLQSFGSRVTGVFGAITGAIVGAGQQIFRFGTIAAAVGAGGLAVIAGGIKKIADSGQDLQATVLALRSLNGEIDKQGRNPSFGFTGGRQVTGVGSFGAKSYGPEQNGFGDVFGRGQSKDDFSFLTKQADTFGLSIQEVGKSYIGFKAASKSANLTLAEQRDLFTGVAEAGTSLSISGDDVAGIFRALTQVASKGQLQAEELRGQIGDRLPGAFGIAARSMGVTEAQLNKLMKDGLVPASTFLRAFGSQLRKEYGAGAQSALNTSRVQAGRLKNVFSQLQAVIFTATVDQNRFNYASSRGLLKGAKAGDTLDKSYGRLLGTITELFQRLGKRGVFDAFGVGLAGIVNRVTGAISRSEGRVESFLALVLRFGNGALTFFGLIGQGFSVLRYILTSPVYSATSPVIRFFQSLVALARSLFALLATTTRPAIFGTLEGGLDRITKLVDGVASSINSFTAGQPDTAPFPGVVAGLEKIQELYGKILVASDRFLQEGIGKYDAEFANGLTNVKAYGEALGALFSGGTDPNGKLSELFKLRDVLREMGTDVVPAIVAVAKLINALAQGAIKIKPFADGLANILGFGSFIELFVVARFLKFIGVFRLLAAGARLAVAAFSGFEIVATLIAGIGAPIAIIIALLVGLGVFIYAYRDDLIAAFKSIWEYFTDTLPREIGNGVDNVLNAIGEFITGAIDAISGMFSAIGAFFKRQWDRIVDDAKLAFAFFTDTLPTIISDGFDAALETIKGWATSLLSIARQVGLGFVDFLLAPFAGLFKLLKVVAKKVGITLFDNIEFPNFTQILGEQETKIEAAARTKREENEKKTIDQITSAYKPAAGETNLDAKIAAAAKYYATPAPLPADQASLKDEIVRGIRETNRELRLPETAMVGGQAASYQARTAASAVQPVPPNPNQVGTTQGGTPIILKLAGGQEIEANTSNARARQWLEDESRRAAAGMSGPIPPWAATAR